MKTLEVTEQKQIEHDLRNKLISTVFALEQITFARYADKCHEIARKALEVALQK